MVLNTSQAWVPRSEQEHFLGAGRVAYTHSYTYLGVTFTGCGKLLVLDFLMDMHPLVLLKDNVHVCSFKSHELNVAIRYTCDSSSLWSRNVGTES